MAFTHTFIGVVLCHILIDIFTAIVSATIGRVVRAIIGQEDDLDQMERQCKENAANAAGKRDDVEKISWSHMRMNISYYKTALQQAKSSFRVARLIALLGTGLFFLARL